LLFFLGLIFLIFSGIAVQPSSEDGSGQGLAKSLLIKLLLSFNSSVVALLKFLESSSNLFKNLLLIPNKMFYLLIKTKGVPHYYR